MIEANFSDMRFIASENTTVFLFLGILASMNSTKANVEAGQQPPGLGVPSPKTTGKFAHNH
jgi:hypothetical protein